MVAVVALPLLVSCAEVGHMMSGRSSDEETGHHMGGTTSTMMIDDESEFLVDMVAHHLDAIVAARQLARSPSPAMRRFGRRIVGDQGVQVRQMRRWLARWYPDAGGSDYEPMMSDLSGLDGASLDRAFLRQMIDHHLMAVMMSRHLLSMGVVRHQAVAALARVIIRDQTAEIGWMRDRLVG